MTAENGGVLEAEVIQNGQFRCVDRYGHLRSEWTSQKDFIYPVNQTVGFFFNFCDNYGKNQFLSMKMFNNRST